MLRTALPHILTACVAIALTLGISGLWMRPSPVRSFPQTAVPVTAGPLSPPTPVPTPQVVPPGIARQEIADLRAEDNRLWVTVYVLKAISQVADAEVALRTNDMASVDQSLIAVDYSLSLAYARAEESQQSPIDQFRRTVDRIHTDIYLYPERLDVRLVQLRQFLLTLIDEPK